MAVAPNESLKLPSNIRHFAAGGEASLAQLIVTWAQKVTQPHLETYIQDAAGKPMEGFPRRLYGLIAALCADSITGVGAAGNITAPLRAAALARLNQLSSPTPKPAYRGPTAEVVCVDHLGLIPPDLLYRKSLYDGASLRSREELREVSSKLLQAIFTDAYIGALDPDVPKAIGGMLFELFKNTEDHGMVDVHGDLLNISIRALKASHTGVTPADLAAIVGSFEPLARYCESLEVPVGSVQTHLFELSILDSGPGFASSWTKKPLDELTPEAEEAAVRACFEQGTSKSHDRFGQGLPHVLRLLKSERGFLRLRTGRLSFFADYSKSDQAAEGPSVLRLWSPNDGAPLGAVSGSLLTIMLPMRRRS